MNIAEKLKQNKKSTLILVTGALLIGVALIIGLIINYQNSNKPPVDEEQLTSSNACNEAHIERFVAAADEQDLEAMYKLRTEIEQLDNYQGSDSCQYILVRHSLATGDAEQAKSRLDTLKKLAPSSEYLAVEFGNQLVSYESIEDSIESIQFNREANIDEESRFWGDDS